MKESPLNIGIVCYPTFGGSGAVASGLGQCLARRGHTIHFISYSRPFRLLCDNHPNIHHHEIDTMEYPLFLGPLYAISCSVRIADIIREANLDILHVHYALPHAVCAYLANDMLDPSERVPIITTLHGTDITLIGNSPSFRRAVKLGLDKSTLLTCVSHWLADRTCEYFDICDRLNVIYNFIDTDLYTPDASALDRADFAAEGEALLLHVSNFRPVKRLPDVIRTFAKVREAMPARLLLVGDGPELPLALNLAAELGLGDHVTSLGERTDIHEIFPLADLFLFPSNGESFGLAAAESLACEVPVIGARAGGLPEVMTDGEHGRLCEVGDTDAMGEAAIALLRDPEALRTMGAAGRRHILDRFSPDLIVPTYERFYYSTLNRSVALA